MSVWIGCSGAGLCEEELLRELTAEESARLQQDVIEGHQRWTQRLQEVHGSVVLHTLELSPQVIARPMINAEFWRKGEQYREDICPDDLSRPPERTAILSPRSYIEAQLRANPPFVRIQRAPGNAFRWRPNTRDAVFYILLGYPDRLSASLLAGNKQFTESHTVVDPSGRKMVVARLELTEKGVKELGLPSKPPKSWLKEIVWLDASADYAVIKNDYVAYGAAAGLMIHTYGAVELATDAEGRATIKEVRMAEEHAQRGQIFSKQRFAVEFVSMKFGRIPDEVFTLKGLKPVPGTRIHDDITGKNYNWQDE